jgi:hypothetical protein
VKSSSGPRVPRNVHREFTQYCGHSTNSGRILGPGDSGAGAGVEVHHPGVPGSFVQFSPGLLQVPGLLQRGIRPRSRGSRRRLPGTRSPSSTDVVSFWPPLAAVTPPAECSSPSRGAASRTTNAVLRPTVPLKEARDRRKVGPEARPRRISTIDQNASMQIAVLIEAGVAGVMLGTC